MRLEIGDWLLFNLRSLISLQIAMIQEKNV